MKNRHFAPARSSYIAARFFTAKLVVALLFLFHASFALAIDAPGNPRGSVQNTTTIKWEWDWVNGATQFEVTVDGLYRGLTRDPHYTTYDLWPGEHSMTVKAIDGNWQYSQSSTTIKVNTNDTGQSQPSQNPTSNTNQNSASGGEAVAVPGNLRGTQIAAGTVQWQWDWTPGAASYDLTVDGNYAGSTSDTQYSSQNLWVGDHSLTVKAVSADGRFSQASPTFKMYVSDSNGGSSQDAAAPPPPQDNNNNNGGQQAVDSGSGAVDPNSYQYGEVYQKEGYELSFSDEFNNSSLNFNRWNTQLRWDGEFNGERYEYRVINGESQFYVNINSQDGDHRDFVAPQFNPFELNGSRLAIRAIRNPLNTNNNKAGHGPLRSMVAQQKFLSGAIASYDKFTQKYGYFEARIKIPSHVGAFPAFWLHHQKRKSEGTKRTEIDIMENLGHAPWYIYNSFHYFDNVSASYDGDARFVKPQPEGQIYTGTDYSNDYHVYAVEWEPGHITWFIDGQKVSELYNSNVDHEELYVLLNLAIGGHWTNYPESSGGLGRHPDNYFPNNDDLNNFSNPALEIDYVRVYKRK